MKPELSAPGARAESHRGGKWNLLLWAGGACVAVGWIAEMAAAALGPTPPWPGWLMLIAVTGVLISNFIKSTRPRVLLVVAMALLSVFAAIGIARTLH